MRSSFAWLVVGFLLSRAAPAALPSYAFGTVPATAEANNLEFPIAGDFRGQAGLVLLTQGTFDDNNPFAHLSQVSPSIWLHYDGVENLRLSAAFQEFWQLSISELGIPAGHEERLVGRARLQQPRGTSALYQLLQLDVRSFDDPTGKHQVVFRPRLRVGVGFNLDAARIHSATLYQEAALRFGDDAYIKRNFEFYRGVVGYTWTTRRGLFVTLGFLGQISLNPGGSALTFLYGPILGLAYRIAPNVKLVETPPEPPELETE